MSDKGMVVIYILEILGNYSSQGHRLRQSDIVEYLECEYGILLNRNTVARYLLLLKEHGFIEGERGVFLKRKLSNPQIKMILDTLLFSKAIPKKDVQSIMRNLKEMAEPEFRKYLNCLCFVDGLDYTENENIGDLLEQITMAIQQSRKIEITTCAYDVSGKNLVITGKRRVSPYYVVMEKGRYYLLCFSGREDVEPRRLDRMAQVKILKEARKEIYEIPKYANHTFSLDKYLREHIYMYSGNEERITIRIKRKNIGDFIDWYGKEYRVIRNKAEEDDVTVQVRSNVNAAYFWALQYGAVAEVLEPESLRRKIQEGLESLLQKYKKKT